MADGTETRDQLARIDAKLDVLLAQHSHVAAQVADHEGRMRELESARVRTDGRVDDLTARDTDQETRLRSADRWRYAVPLTAVGALLTGTAAIIAALGK